MRCMLFAAGLGTRLKPLTDRMPKALVPVNGQPLLEITIARLRKFGASEIVINIHHFADQIVRYLATHDFGIPVRISDEREMLLDTGGGLRRALPMFTPATDSTPILIHNVDILSNADLGHLYTHHDADCGAQLLVSERETSRYLLFNSEGFLVGWTNVKTGEIRTPYSDLDATQCRKYAFSGIHTFNPALLSLMQDYPERFSIMDFYLSICHEVPIKAYVQPDLQLLDVGKQDTLTVAETFLKRVDFSVK